MLVTPSPLVSSMSGKTAGLVAASWKGRQYVRRHVIPANPNTAAQQAVRNSLARCVLLWRSLAAFTKAWLDSYGADYRMSGYNVFMSKNRALEQVPSNLKPVPDNPHVPVPSDFTAATGAGASGDIDCTWTDDSPTDFDNCRIYARDIAGNIFNAEIGPGSVLEAGTISGLEPGETYDVYAAWCDNTNGDIGTIVCIADVDAKA